MGKCGKGNTLHASMKGILKALIISCFCSTAGFAQQVTFSTDSTKALPTDNTPPPQKIKPVKVKPIRHEISLGGRLNTDGWSVYTDYGKVKASDQKKSDMFYNLLYLQTEFTEKKDPKEQKVNSQALTSKGSSSYIYGKINNFYALKVGVGYSRMIAGKPDPGCVSIHWANTLGFALGMMKPYYLSVVGSSSYIKYSDLNQSDFLNSAIIQGSGGFSKGLGEMVFIPGGHIKSSLHFDFSANRKTVLAVETGVNAEFYSQPITLMANGKSVSNFIDLFVSFQFGRRW